MTAVSGYRLLLSYDNAGNQLTVTNASGAGTRVYEE